MIQTIIRDDPNTPPWAASASDGQTQSQYWGENHHEVPTHSGQMQQPAITHTQHRQQARHFHGPDFFPPSVSPLWCLYTRPGIR